MLSLSSLGGYRQQEHRPNRLALLGIPFINRARTKLL